MASKVRQNKCIGMNFALFAMRRKYRVTKTKHINLTNYHDDVTYRINNQNSESESSNPDQRQMESEDREYFIITNYYGDVTYYMNNQNSESEDQRPMESEDRGIYPNGIEFNVAHFVRRKYRITKARYIIQTNYYGDVTYYINNENSESKGSYPDQRQMKSDAEEYFIITNYYGDVTYYINNQIVRVNNPDNRQMENDDEDESHE